MSLIRLTSPLARTFYSTPFNKNAIKYQKLSSLLQKRTIVTHMETNQPKTFSNQNKIPRLPIPTLKETAERYKKSLLPLLSTSDYNQAVNAVDEFMKEGGFAEVLQERLQNVDKSEKYNWLETIWLNKAYLEWRDPSLINVNWWVEFNDPATGILKNPPPKGQISEFQIDRAAGLISNTLTFNDMINNELLPPETTRQGPLCMDQYTKQFGATRIADFPADRERVPIKEIKRQLISVADQVNGTKELQPPIGLLTGEHRDTWATARKKLESSSTVNKISIEAIDTALFCVALDDYPLDQDIDISHHNNFHAYNGRNRWFDKAIQIIVANNGRGGVNGEHSPSDAVIPGRIFDYILSNEPAQDLPNASPIVLLSPQYLKWDVDNSIMNTIQQAQINIQAAIDNVDSVLLHYTEYGADWLKKAKVSPDAFVQMAIQLAYYKHYNEPCATYESASIRGFLHGRTETVRTCSVDTVAFTKAFCDPSVKKEEKISLLMKAIESHIEYMKSATNATLFNDPSYIKSMYFKLSTSNMSPSPSFHCGYGAVVPDGYGVCYIIRNDKLKISISSFKKCNETDSSTFRKVLKASLDDLRELL
ncbi:3646_t:CDS:10 [Scutellospora calospora]|uniref:3646_t:CDS:1 n=1 Tax=Scutellospora calospora TaxID=85575 RepID=A0ACA9JV84_9GLOM|nr:3646_t:CDS:10 [Scutellospora calospora]